VHPVTDTHSEDCHSGTELLCRRSKVGAKRRFCSAVLFVSAHARHSPRRVGVSNLFSRLGGDSVDANGAFPSLAAAPATPLPGTVLKL
jgi:hypothetical protein